MEENIVKTLKESWQETRKLTHDFIEQVPLGKFNKELPRPGLNTLAKHIYELTLVQKVYARAIEGKPLDFSDVEAITFGEEDYQAPDKKDMKKKLRDAEGHFNNAMKQVEDWGAPIELFGKKVPTYSAIELTIRHETLHHGQFVAFGYFLEIDFPESWVKAWALP